MGILENINGHEDLIHLNEAQLEQLCSEIRQFLIDSVSKTGGHLASNLGVVELTVALETVFDSARDRLVFDVGHQSYVHKLLTGRADRFDSLRQFGGMAGFPKPSESITDAFVAGHASSSVSIALGMARARTLQHEKYHVVAVIGDGAATGGMVYEAMNDAAESKEPLIIILNDNEMSIDRNVGGFARHLNRLRTKEKYLGMKAKYKSFLHRIPGGATVFRITRAVKDWIKRMVLPTTVFENIGLTYLGPVDGHDTQTLISLLRSARDMKTPVLIHVVTQKGRGYCHAEDHPSKFHGVGKFDPESGLMLKKSAYTFSDAFGDEMQELAATDPRVCAITAAMPGGTGLLGYKERFSQRLFDVGIAEEHAVSMAGGLAKQGMIPVAAIYSTFLQRSFDQIMQDIAMLRLHVVLAVDRAGLVGEDGETHHGVFDIGFLRQAPGMAVLCPASCAELRDMLRWAVLSYDGPVALRYPRGGDRGYGLSQWDTAGLVNGEGQFFVHCQGTDFAIISYGTMVNTALDAAQKLSDAGVEVAVIRLLTVSPLPGKALMDQIPENCPVLILEETGGRSGIRGELSEMIHNSRSACRVYGIDLGNEYVTHGSLDALYQEYGMDADSVVNFVREVLEVEK